MEIPAWLSRVSSGGQNVDGLSPDFFQQLPCGQVSTHFRQVVVVFIECPRHLPHAVLALYRLLTSHGLYSLTNGTTFDSAFSPSTRWRICACHEWSACSASRSKLYRMYASSTALRWILW